MKQIHFMTGLPWSGSQLLTDVLNQNPAIHASSTSPMDATYSTVYRHWGVVSPESVHGLLAHNESLAVRRMCEYQRQALAGWYSDLDPGATVIDKGRYWINELDHLVVTHPSSKVICTIRNPLNCFASAHGQFLRGPRLHDGGPPNEPLFAKVDRYFHPEGPLGANMVRIEDKLATPKLWPSLIYVVYEQFASSPKKTLRKLYADLELDWYEHDFDLVEPTAYDLDVLTSYNFRHDRKAGPVTLSMTDWRQYMPVQKAQRIAALYPHIFDKWKEFF